MLDRWPRSSTSKFNWQERNLGKVSDIDQNSHLQFSLWMFCPNVTSGSVIWMSFSRWAWQFFCHVRQMTMLAYSPEWQIEILPVKPCSIVCILPILQLVAGITLIACNRVATVSVFERKVWNNVSPVQLGKFAKGSHDDQYNGNDAIRQR